MEYQEFAHAHRHFVGKRSRRMREFFLFTGFPIEFIGFPIEFKSIGETNRNFHWFKFRENTNTQNH